MILLLLIRILRQNCLCPKSGVYLMLTVNLKANTVFVIFKGS